LQDFFVQPYGIASSGGVYRTEEGNSAVKDWAYKQVRRFVEIRANPNVCTGNDSTVLSPAAERACEALYQYRTEPGGTDGLDTNRPWETLANIQALNKTGTTDVAWSLVAIGDATIRLVSAYASAGVFESEVTSDWAGQFSLQMFSAGVQVFPLLDNYSDDYELSRMAINRVVSRNPVDVALMILTSCNNEYWRGDATGGTAPVPTFAAVGNDDFWIGYALHCVEGANKGYARLITDNDAASITVAPAFPNAPAAGDEYQVRNTIYDVLPITWGMGIHHDNIDVAAFETIRDKYLSDARLAKFAIGYEQEQNLWDMVLKQILAPYLIAVRFDYTTTKLSAVFTGDAFGDGIVETYVAVGINDIIEIGDMDYGAANPISSVQLSVRDTWTAVIGLTGFVDAYGSSYQKWYQGITETTGQVSSIDPMAGKMATIEIVDEDQTDAHLVSAKNAVKISSPFNTLDDVGNLISLWNAAVKLRFTPRPQTSLRLHVSLWPSIHEGSLLSITNPFAVNPCTGSCGWTGA
jgi:hypothetical protein